MMKISHDPNELVQDMCAINDPLGQSRQLRSLFSLENFFLRYLEKWGRMDGQTTCAKIIITTGRDLGRPRGSISTLHVG